MPSCRVITVYGRDSANKSSKIVDIGCKKWDCPICAPRRAKYTAARIIKHMQAAPDGTKWYLLTLTVAANKRGMDASVDSWRASWRTIYYAMKNLIRAEPHLVKGDSLYYVKVYEKHKDGTLHCHMIANLNLQSSRRRAGGKDEYVWRETYKVKRRKQYKGKDQWYYRSQWLADNSVRAGLGYICECRPIEGKESGDSAFIVAAYVTKYLLKQIGAGMPKNFHRVEFSQNWPALNPSENPYQWDVAAIADIMSDYVTSWDIDDMSQDRILAIAIDKLTDT